MAESLKILLLEDVYEDFELIKREVRKNFPNSEILHLDNEADFRNQLEEYSPDLILSDYNLPQFTGLEALQIVRKVNKNLPFLIVTGSINEETAVDCIKAGATDYIIKENLMRLNPAIKSALAHSDTLKEKEDTEKALAESERRFRHSFNYANIGQALIDTEGKLLKINPKFIEIFKLQGTNKPVVSNIFNYVYSEDKSVLQQKFEDAINGEFDNISFEIRFIDSTNQIVWGQVTFSIVRENYLPLYFVMHVQDITLRIIAYEKIRKLSLSVEQSPVSIVITDTKGVIEYVNLKFVEVTGYGLDEIIGNNPRILKSGIQNNEFYKDLWETIKSGQNWKGEICNKKKSGELFWENTMISPVIDDKNNITHFVSIREDITDKKKMIDELIIAKEKAEESDRLKSSFLASMSHEIRTPLNAIVGFSSLIAENTNDPKFVDFSKIIGTQNDLLLHMINDIIEFAKMESQAMEINKEVFDLTKLMNDLFIMYESKCQPDVELIPKIQSKPMLVYSDKFKITQIFSNLISNAIKFTEKGNITFGYDLYEDTKLRFFVSDTGIGISNEQKEEIFKRFTKLDSFSQGVGLGLSIVKNIVEFLDGEIWLESETNVGSSFYFELPSILDKSIREEPNKEVKFVSQKKAETITHGTILVAEDNESNFLFIKELFLDKDINILHAFNGQEAIDVCRTNDKIDLVLMDIKMTIMNGLEATRQIKKFKPNLPIIAQTAFASHEDKVKAKEAGCDDYISKPINKDDLFEVIRRYLD